MKAEVRNIADVEREEIAAGEGPEEPLSAFLAGSSSEGFELPEGWESWLQDSSVGTVAEASGSS